MNRAVSLVFNPGDRKYDLLQCMKTYTSIYDSHIDWSLSNKSYSKQAAHQALYANLRQQYPQFPSALLQAARDNAMESMKQLKCATKPKKAEYSTIRFDQRTASLRGYQLTLSCLGKRIKTIIQIPEYFLEIFNTWQFCSCTISFNPRKQQFRLNLVYKKDNPTLSTNTDVLGVDRGLYNIATTSTGELFSGQPLRAIRRRFLHNRKTLQAKGTHSAKRRLKAMSSGEKRFSSNVNHIIAKKIVTTDCGIIVLEELQKIVRDKGKIANKWLSDWSFWQLERMLQYKAEAVGKQIGYVDPRYTSQKCNCCKYISKKNRHKGRFTCQRCGYSEQADIVGAKNIRDDYILSTQASRAGCSQSPNDAGTKELVAGKLLGLS